MCRQRCPLKVTLPFCFFIPLQVAVVLVLVLMIVLVLHWLTETRRRVWQQAAQNALRSFQGLRFPVSVR